MAPKLAPASKGGAASNVKVTPSPPRYKEGEAPPLPEWPINWSCVGICIETLLALDPGTLVEAINQMRPTYSMAIVDASNMASEEMAVDPPTTLGIELKAAMASRDVNWLNPKLLSKVLEARSRLDKDDEHRREALRRMDVAKLCKKNIEEAIIKESEAKLKFEESLLKLKEFEDKTREAEEATKQRPSIEATIAIATIPAKIKPLPLAKGALPSTPTSGSYKEKKALEEKIAQLRALLQCHETKVKVAKYWDIKGDFEKDDPLIQTRIYWCIGFGSTPQALSEQVTVKNIFQAIFNIAKKVSPPPSLEVEGALDKSSVVSINSSMKTPTTLLPTTISTKLVPVPPFIQELFELAKISKQDHPSRKLPVLNVFYEDLPSEEENLPDGTLLALSKASPPAISKKLSQSTSVLPYEQIAKAVIEATILLKQHVEAFALLEACIIESCTIPEATPMKDVNMTYYKALLDGVPLDFISIPIIIHCMVEQVSISYCPLEDLEALEIAKKNQHLAKGLDDTFQKLGHGLSCMRKPSDILTDLTERIEAQVAREAKETKEAAEKALEVEKIVAQEVENALKLVHNHTNATSKTTSQEIPLITSNLQKNKFLVLQNNRELSNVTSVVNEQPFIKRGSLMLQDLVKVGDDVSQISDLSEGSSIKTQEGEDHLIIIHEFDRVGRLKATIEQQKLEFWDSIDVVKVEKHMLSLLAYPGKRRACMPIIPILSEERRCACLEALKMFASGGPQVEGKETYPLCKELDDIYGPPVILEILEDPSGPSFSLIPVNIATVRRYQKLKMFLEMLLKEQRRVFNIPSTSKERTPPMSNCDDDLQNASKLDDGLTNEQREELEKEIYLVDCGCPGVKIYQVPTPPFKLDLNLVSPLSSKSSNIFLTFQRILNRKMIESFPDGFLGEIYGTVKTRLPYRIRRYDRNEDCLLEALYADERDHEWKGTVASQMGFGEFVANMNTPSPSMLIHDKHATYDIEQRDAIVVERFKCHMTEDQGLVWTGLPAKGDIQWEPQTTVIKDGNMIFLRGYGPNDNSESPTIKSVFSILRDGLVVCFFIGADGVMSMQMTNLASKTIEINSIGIVLMFSSQRHAKSELEENEAEEEIPMEAISGKDASKVNPKDKEEIGSEVKKELTTSNIQTIRNILLQEKGDLEAWRCILPSGTVVRYMNNGNAQILCRQGNVSDWRNDFEGGSCWITTNNEGFLVVQQDPPSKEEKPLQPNKVPNTNIEPVEPKPILVELPNLKVAHFYDPDTKDEIMTREDLVVVVTCEEQHSKLVQHADGTHIYSEVWDYFLPNPIEVIVPPEHIFGEWPTSCKNKEPIKEGDEKVKDQNSSIVNGEQRTSIIDVNAKTNEGEIEILKQKPKIVEQKNLLENVASKEDYEKKQPLQGLLGELPTKYGIKLSDFADAQKKHSQTWAPEGYGEAPRDILDWMWPPQPPKQQRKRYTTPPPKEDLVLPLETPIKKPNHSIVWHVRKDGLAKVHGKVEAGTCVEFETEDGHYIATWSKKTSFLTLSMPGGATLSASGNIVTYNPSTGSKSDNDVLQSEGANGNNPKGSNNDWNSSKIQDADEKDKNVLLLNTHSCYIFDVVEGTLLYTNKAGNGFKVFGRGFEFERITNSKLESQIAKEVEELQMQKQMFDMARARAEDLLKEMLELVAANAKDCKFVPKLVIQKPTKDMLNTSSKESDLETLPKNKINSIIKKNEDKELRLMTKEEQSKKPFDPFDGFDLELPGTWRPTPTPTPTPPSEPPEQEILGPFPRLFVVHEGGYGYEILANEMYQLYEIAKFYNKHCTKSNDKCIISNEDCILHTFVTIEIKNNMSLNELLKDEEKTQTSFPITPWLLTRRISQFARKFEAKQRKNKVQNQSDCDWLQLEFILPNLARIINPVLPKLPPEIDSSTFVYRQILENPSISKETCINIEKILEAYTEWLSENIDNPRCEAIWETRSDRDIEIEQFVALTKAEKLAEHEVQKARKHQGLQTQDARRVIRQKLREPARKAVEEAARQQSLLQSDIDEDWRLFVESKGGPFVCMHKPTDLLQTDPPFHPIPSARFLFFHAEEGLKYLFICQQELNEAKRWSIETMPPSPKSSIHSNEYFQDLTEAEGKELTNMFAGMIGKVEEFSKEVLKAEEDEKKRKEGEKFCKQVFSEVLVPKDPFHDFTADQSSSEEEESCIFDYPTKPEKKPEPRPPHVYEFSPTLPCLGTSLPPCAPLPPPPPLPLPSQMPLKPVPVPASPHPPVKPKPPEISGEEKNKLARDAWRAQRMAQKELKSKTLDSNWMIPQEFDYDYEIYMKARAFKKAFWSAKWKSNEFYITRELPNERLVQMEISERMKLTHDPLNALEWVKRQFRIFPPIIDFHIVQLGTMRMKIVIVQNYHGPRSGRIFIHNEDKLSVKFHYFHGSIAPGMYIVLRVYFRASKLGMHLSQAEIKTDSDVYTITIKAFVITGLAALDPNDQIEVVVRSPCDEPVDPWGTFILCRRCFTHHLHWWSKNWGLYECTKCWHFHVTQEWLDAIAEKAQQKQLEQGAKKANRG